MNMLDYPLNVSRHVFDTRLGGCRLRRMEGDAAGSCAVSIFFLFWEVRCLIHTKSFCTLEYTMYLYIHGVHVYI